MKQYQVRTACEVAGVWREAGEKLDLTDDQAKHLTAPFGSVLEEVTADKGEEKQARGKLDRD